MQVKCTNRKKGKCLILTFELKKWVTNFDLVTVLINKSVIILALLWLFKRISIKSLSFGSYKICWCIWRARDCTQTHQCCQFLTIFVYVFEPLLLTRNRFLTPFLCYKEMIWSHYFMNKLPGHYGFFQVLILNVCLCINHFCRSSFAKARNETEV